MSDLDEYIEEPTEEVVEEVVEEVAEKPAEFDYQAAQAERASQSGWVPLEEWVEAGHKAEDWADATTFNVRGEFIGKLRAKDREIDERIEGLNKAHEAQMKVQRAELESQKAEAISMGGREAVETVKNIDYQLQNLNAPVAPPPKDSLVAEWEANNPWIDEPGPKSVYANTLFSQAQQGGLNTQQALAHVNQEIAKAYPAKVQTAAMSEKGSKPGRKAASKSLSMGDLTREELKWREAMPDAWPTDEKFLKAVKDARAS